MAAVKAGAVALLILATAPALASEPARVAAGAEIYAAECASCHGANLEGQPDWREEKADGTMPAPPHDADGHTWHHPDGMLFAYTKLGGQETLRRMGVTGFKSAMPAFGDRLSDQEIADVLAFIRSRWPEEMRAYQAERTRDSGG